MKADDRLPDAHYDLGLILASRKRFEEAVAQFEITVRLRPDYPDAEASWAAALQSLGRTDEARIHFANAARLPGSPAAPPGP